ncbi:hypothetical protein C4544_04290 [candidate division WS5 bacterium]|uniref:Glycosyltransferase family 1 protein n=1 Tax=candidate division WS5 bacterium TaxID=2093353 RepID=A0A419DCH1_9BACT|nr:MAG: hypothetical protein C4544_04290 [candidate division WS5 bacterium]
MEHVPFNAALLKTIRTAFPDKTIDFWGEDSHIEEIKRQLGASYSVSIKWSSIMIPPRHAGFYKRFLPDLQNIKFLLDKLNSEPSSDVLVITFGNASILWTLKYYISSVNKDKKIQVVLHGDFSKLRYRASLRDHLNPLYHIGTLKTALRFACEQRIQYIVLEEAIHSAIIEVMPFLGDRFSVFDHPLPGDNKPVGVCDLTSPVQIGFLGAASERKGFIRYLQVAADVKRQMPGLADFHLVGYISEYQRNYDFDCLIDKPTTQRLNRDEYVNRLNKLHFVCLFYEREYELTASGVLLDCIEYGKPIIASRLPIFEMPARKLHDIGYLCDSDEFSRTIINIINTNDSARYEKQVQNMLRLKVTRSPETLANVYRGLIEYGHA